MKTAHVSLRHMTLALLLAGVVGSACAAGPATSPVAALSAASGAPVLAPSAPAISDSNTAVISPVSPVPASINGEDSTESTLKQVGALQAKYALRKIQVDIDKLDTPNPTAAASKNPLDALRAAGTTGPQVIPLAAPAPVKPVVQAPPPPMHTMKAIGTYGVGSSAYADLLIDDGRSVVTPGSELSNGYKVVAIDNSGVTLVKGKKREVLPVVPAPAQAMSGPATNVVNSMVGGPNLGGPGTNIATSSMGNRFNQLTGPMVIPSDVGEGGALH